MVLKDALQFQIFTMIDFAFENSKLDSDYEKKYTKQIFVNKSTNKSPFDLIINDIQQLSDEGWELTEQRVNQIDFGSVIFNNREIEGVIIEMILAKKNRLIGKFSKYCKRIHVMKDEDFDMWRNNQISECNDASFSQEW